MAEIIEFWEAKLAIETRELRARLEREYDERQEAYWAAKKAESVECSMREEMERLVLTKEIKPPKKKAKIISALPGETIPPEYEDLRPLLQRDGLILLSWAIWENYDEDGVAVRVNWIKSNGGLRRYCGFWTDVHDDDGMGVVLPDRKGDCDYREGTFYSNSRGAADFVFICAPEFNSLSRLVFIEKLKETGVNVNFDFDFNLGLAKQLQFQKQVEFIQSLGSQGVQSG